MQQIACISKAKIRGLCSCLYNCWLFSCLYNCWLCSCLYNCWLCSCLYNCCCVRACTTAGCVRVCTTAGCVRVCTTAGCVCVCTTAVCVRACLQSGPHESTLRRGVMCNCVQNGRWTVVCFCLCYGEQSNFHNAVDICKFSGVSRRGKIIRTRVVWKRLLRKLLSYYAEKKLVGTSHLLTVSTWLCRFILLTFCIFYVYGSVHHNIFYEITNRCSYMQSILFHC